MKKYALLFALLGLASCEIYFDLDKVSEPAFYVQYLPSSGAEADIMVAYAEPAFDKVADKAHPFDISDVKITVNGTVATLSEDTERSSWNRHFLHVSTSSPIKSGDEISVTVTGKDVPAATASTRVPERPVIKSVTFSQDPNDTTDLWKITIKLDKPVKEGEYYGIKAAKHGEWYAASGTDPFHFQIDTTAYTEYFNPGQVADFSDLNSLDLDNYASISYQNGFLSAGMFMGECLTLLTSRQFDGDTYTFYANAVDSFSWSDYDFDFDFSGLDDYSPEVPDYPEPGPEEGEEEEDPYEEPGYWMYLGEKNTYRFEIYRLSEEFYNYAKAQYLSTYNMLSNFGVTPPNFTYSNVAGGLGIVAGLAGSFTEWISPPEKDSAE